MYTDFLLMGGQQSVAMGTHFSAAADGKTGYVTRADCARAAAAALMKATGRKTLDITGPETVSQAEVAAILSEIAGKEIPYVALPAEDLVQAMIANGLPEFMARVFASFDEAIAQGYLDVASGDLESLTGKPGQSVADFLAANRAALLQAPQEQ
jgi:NAD(P)H dehydrogenase (quinone)